MAKKKAKEEVMQSLQPEVDTSNRVEDEGANPASSSVKTEGNGNIVIQEGIQSEELSQEEVTEENVQEEQPKTKLRVLAGDRLNSLLNEANELGITDVVQILNSDRFGQFYLVYRK
jgi:hypothetical protein